MFVSTRNRAEFDRIMTALGFEPAEELQMLEVDAASQVREHIINNPGVYGQIPITTQIPAMMTNNR